MKSKYIKDLEKILKALANKRRLAMVIYLKKNQKASVGEISGEIELSFKATSKHLSVLFAADILEKDNDGLRMIYRLNGEMPSFAKLIIDSF